MPPKVLPRTDKYHISLTKTFGGKRFTFADVRRTKKEAEARARVIRGAYGRSVRIVKVPKAPKGMSGFSYTRYALYVR